MAHVSQPAESARKRVKILCAGLFSAARAARQDASDEASAHSSFEDDMVGAVLSASGGLRVCIWREINQGDFSKHRNICCIGWLRDGEKALTFSDDKDAITLHPAAGLSVDCLDALVLIRGFSVVSSQMPHSSRSAAGAAAVPAPSASAPAPPPFRVMLVHDVTPLLTAVEAARRLGLTVALARPEAMGASSSSDAPPPLSFPARVVACINGLNVHGHHASMCVLAVRERGEEYCKHVPLLMSGRKGVRLANLLQIGRRYDFSGFTWTPLLQCGEGGQARLVLAATGVGAASKVPTPSWWAPGPALPSAIQLACSRPRVSERGSIALPAAPSARAVLDSIAALGAARTELPPPVLPPLHTVHGCVSVAGPSHLLLAHPAPTPTLVLVPTDLALHATFISLIRVGCTLTCTGLLLIASDEGKEEGQPVPVVYLATPCTSWRVEDLGAQTTEQAAAAAVALTQPVSPPPPMNIHGIATLPSTAQALLKRVGTLWRLACLLGSFSHLRVGLDSAASAPPPWVYDFLACTGERGEGASGTADVLHRLSSGRSLVDPPSPPLLPFPLLTPTLCGRVAVGVGHALRSAWGEEIQSGRALPWHWSMKDDRASQERVRGALASRLAHACALTIASLTHQPAPRARAVADSCSVHVSEHWTSVRIPCTTLYPPSPSPPRLACQYGYDPSSGYVTGGDGSTSLHLHGFVPAGRLTAHGEGAPVEILSCEGWEVVVDVVPCPVLLEVPPGEEGKKEEEKARIDVSLAVGPCSSRVPPRVPGLGLSSALPLLLCAPTLTSVEGAGCMQEGEGAWGGGWAGGWTDAWASESTPRESSVRDMKVLHPKGAGSSHALAAAFVQNTQWRIRAHLAWTAQGTASPPPAMPHSLMQLRSNGAFHATVPPVAQTQAAHSPAFWFCASGPPRLSVSRRPIEYASAQFIGGIGSAWMVSMEGVACPLADQRTGTPVHLTPLPPSYVPGSWPPPLPRLALCELANVGTDGRSRRDLGDERHAVMEEGKGWEGASNLCLPHLPPGMTLLHPGSCTLIQRAGAGGTFQSRMALDGSLMRMDAHACASVSGTVRHAQAASLLSPPFGQASAVAAGDERSWPGRPRLCLTVRGCLGAQGECFTQVRGDDKIEVCKWEAEHLAIGLEREGTEARGGGEGAAADSVWSGEGGGGSTMSRGRGGKEAAEGRPPNIAILGRVVGMRLVAEPEGEGESHETGGGRAPGLDPPVHCDEVYGRWVGVGPAGRAKVTAVLTLQHVGAHGEEEGDTLCVYVPLQNSSTGHVLPYGFGPSCILLLTQCTREYGGGHRVYLSARDECALHVLAETGHCSGSGYLARVLDNLGGVFTVLDEPRAQLPAPPLAFLGEDLSRTLTRVRLQVTRLLTLSIGWTDPVTGQPLVPPPLDAFSAAPLHLRSAWWRLLPKGSPLFAPLASQAQRQAGQYRYLVRRDHAAALPLAARAWMKRAQGPGGDSLPQIVNAPHPHPALCTLRACVNVGDGTCGGRMDGTDSYGEGEVEGGEGALGPIAALFHFTHRQLAHWAAAASVFGALEVSTLFGAALDSSSGGSGGQAAWSSVESAAAGGAMFGTWLAPQGVGVGAGGKPYNPLSDSPRADAAYWRGVRLAMGRARELGEEGVRGEREARAAAAAGEAAWEEDALEREAECVPAVPTREAECVPAVASVAVAMDDDEDEGERDTPPPKVYAVSAGRQTGVFFSWRGEGGAERAVSGYGGALYKGLWPHQVGEYMGSLWGHEQAAALARDVEASAAWASRHPQWVRPWRGTGGETSSRQPILTGQGVGVGVPAAAVAGAAVVPRAPPLGRKRSRAQPAPPPPPPPSRGPPTAEAGLQVVRATLAARLRGLEAGLLAVGGGEAEVLAVQACATPSSATGRPIPPPAHLRVSYAHAAGAASVLRKQVLGRLGGRAQGKGSSPLCWWSCTVSPVWRGMKDIPLANTQEAAGEGEGEGEGEAADPSTEPAMERVSRRLSREVQYRRDVALRTHIPSIRALCAWSILRARDVALGISLATWTSRIQSGAALAGGTLVQQRVLAGRAAVRAGAAGGDLGLPTLPYAQGRAGAGGRDTLPHKVEKYIRVLLPREPTGKPVFAEVSVRGGQWGGGEGVSASSSSSSARAAAAASPLRYSLRQFRLHEAVQLG